MDNLDCVIVMKTVSSAFKMWKKKKKKLNSTVLVNKKTAPCTSVQFQRGMSSFLFYFFQS